MSNLTPRERLIWRAVINGVPMKVIASDIGVCRDTASRIRQSLKRKLGITNNGPRDSGSAALVRAAAENGLI